MRAAVSIVLICLAVAALPIQAQQNGKALYQIHFDSNHDMELYQDPKTNKILIKISFVVSTQETGAAELSADYRIRIVEDGKPVMDVDLPRAHRTEELDIMLALDTSGSMKEHGRIAQARAAAATFLKKLPAKADCGLIFFDHELRPPILPLSRDRDSLQKEIDRVEPRGGTAYRDAAIKAIEMLATGPKGRDRALVLMTDGLDINSVKPPLAVIELAKRNKVRIYTIGIGEPGKMEIVSSVLVLDHSGSMQSPADDQDAVSKIVALHRAASRFIDIMPESARTTLIPFASGVGTPEEFSNRKIRLKDAIERLAPGGETALFDACHAAIATLEADGKKGKRVVVAMTDGIDNSSRRRKDEVIEFAREAKVPLYLLGLGRENELDEDTMRELASQTGGKYYPARNEKSLLEIFENLSIQIHDDGINEEELMKLARETSGQYYPAKNIEELKFILEQVTQVIQKEKREIVFPSLRQRLDGDPRRVSLILIEKTGKVVSDPAVGSVTIPVEKIISVTDGRAPVSGVVIAEMNNLVYLMILGVIVVLIFLPAMLRKGAGAQG